MKSDPTEGDLLWPAVVGLKLSSLLWYVNECIHTQAHMCMHMSVQVCTHVCGGEHHSLLQLCNEVIANSFNRLDDANTECCLHPDRPITEILE